MTTDDKIRQAGYDPSGLSRREQIRFSQVLEHYTPCYGSSTRWECRNTGCTWRKECMTIQAEHSFDVP